MLVGLSVACATAGCPSRRFVVFVAAMGGHVNLTDEQRLAWLRLIRSENVGPAGIMAQTPREVNPPGT